MRKQNSTPDKGKRTFRFILVMVAVMLAVAAGTFGILRLVKGRTPSKAPVDHKDGTPAVAEGDGTLNRLEFARWLYQYLGVQNAQAMSSYEDIAESNPDYPIISTLATWGYLPEGEAFEPSAPVTGEYAATAIVRTLGRNNLAILAGLDASSLIDDELCVAIALTEGILTGDLRDAPLTQEQCETMMETTTALFLSNRITLPTFFDYEVAESDSFGSFHDIREQTVRFEEGSGETVLLSDTIYESGDVLMFTVGEATYLKKIVSYAMNGKDGYRLTVEDIDPMVVFESAVVSVDTQVSTSEFMRGLRENSDLVMEGTMSEEDRLELDRLFRELSEESDAEAGLPVSVTKDSGAVAQEKAARIQALCKKGYEVASADDTVAFRGMTNGLFDEEGLKLAGICIHLGDGMVEVIDLSNGEQIQLSFPEIEMDFDIYLRVENITMKAVLRLKGLSIEYLECGFDLDLSATLSLVAPILNPKPMVLDLPFTIPIPSTPFAISIDLGAQIMAAASLNFTLTVPVGAYVRYEKGKGFPTLSGPGRRPSLTASVKGEFEVKVYPIFSLSLFGAWNIFDVEPFVGTYGAAEYIVHDLSEYECLDAYVAPIGGFMLCGSGDSLLSQVLHALFDVYGYTHYFFGGYTNEETFERKGLGEYYQHIHTESYPGSSDWVRVTECTYGMTEEERAAHNYDVATEKAREEAIRQLKELWDKAVAIGRELWERLHLKSPIEKVDVSPYEKVLRYYYAGVRDGNLPSLDFEFGQDSLDTFGYAYADINGDGVTELLLGMVGSTEEDPFYILYTLVDNEPKVLCKTENFQEITARYYFVTDGETGLVMSEQGNFYEGIPMWHYYMYSNYEGKLVDVGSYLPGSENRYSGHVKMKITYLPLSSLHYDDAEAIDPPKTQEDFGEADYDDFRIHDYAKYEGNKPALIGEEVDDETGEEYIWVEFETVRITTILTLTDEEVANIANTGLWTYYHTLINHDSGQVFAWSLDMEVVYEDADYYWLDNVESTIPFVREEFGDKQHGFYNENNTVYLVEKKPDSNGRHFVRRSRSMGTDSFDRLTGRQDVYGKVQRRIPKDLQFVMHTYDWEWHNGERITWEKYFYEIEYPASEWFDFTMNEDGVITYMEQTNYAG